MTKKATMIIAIVAMLAGFAVLPVAAAGAYDTSGRGVAPGSDLGTYFWERGVHPQYLGKFQSEIPAAEWIRINEIVATANVVDADAAELDYTDDHDALNSLVYQELSTYPAVEGETVYLTLGTTTWSHTFGTEVVDSTTDDYGFPTPSN